MKHVVRRCHSILGLALLLAACGNSSAPPNPVEPDANSMAYFCGMSLLEHGGPKGQIIVKNKDQPLWFASPGEVFNYLATEGQLSAQIRAIYVNDMSRGSWEKPAPGAWVEAEKAVYVVGSRKQAEMGGVEAVPFSTREQAEKFAAEFGGTIADYKGAYAQIAEK